MATISKRTLRYIIDTSDAEDHTGGNEKIAATGEIIPFDEGDIGKVQNALSTHKASVISYLSVFDRMTGGERQIPCATGRRVAGQHVFLAPKKALLQ